MGGRSGNGGGGNDKGGGGIGIGRLFLFFFLDSYPCVSVAPSTISLHMFKLRESEKETSICQLLTCRSDRAWVGLGVLEKKLGV